MKRKGCLHGERSDDEKIFFAKRKTSISERRRERLERQAAEEAQKQKRDKK